MYADFKILVTKCYLMNIDENVALDFRYTLNILVFD